MNINIESYVSNEEIKDAILSAVKEKVYSMNEEDIERIYTNACYKAVANYSDEIIKEKGLEFSVENKVKEVIDNLSAFTIFYSDRYGHGRNSKAYNLTQQIVEEEKELLREVIKEELNEAYSNYASENDIADLMSEAVYEIFSIKKSS